MREVPPEAERASLMLEMMRAERQAAAAIAGLRAADDKDKAAALKAHEHAFDRLSLALAEYVELVQADAADDDDGGQAAEPAGPGDAGRRHEPAPAIAPAEAEPATAPAMHDVVKHLSADLESLRVAIAQLRTAHGGQGATEPGASEGAALAAAAEEGSAGAQTRHLSAALVRLEALEERVQAVERRLRLLEV